MRLPIALLLCSCATTVSDPRVMQLTQGAYRCTAAAIAPLTALTAGHCVGPAIELDGEPAQERELWEPGVDIASLQPAAPFPAFFEYATRAPVKGELLELIGYGCYGRQRLSDLRYLGPGLADGQACHGDSGGPLLNEQGQLVGIFSGWSSNGSIRFVQITKQP
jgi:hypothetical protein